MRQLSTAVKAIGGIAVVLLLGYLFYFGGTDLIRSPKATATAAGTKPTPEGWGPPPARRAPAPPWVPGPVPGAGALRGLLRAVLRRPHAPGIPPAAKPGLWLH